MVKTQKNQEVKEMPKFVIVKFLKSFEAEGNRSFVEGKERRMNEKLAKKFEADGLLEILG